MAVAWAVPMTVIPAIPILALRPTWLLPLSAMVWALAIAVFTIYDSLLRQSFIRLAIVASLVPLAIAAIAGASTAALIAAPIGGIVFSALLTFDYSGSTPIEGGSHFKEARWHIELDLDRCKGVYFCWQVCPEACFDKREDVRKVEIARSDSCIRCGACVVQCPTDALSFEDESGQRIEPETIRRFKLNLLGQRTVDAGVTASEIEEQF